MYITLNILYICIKLGLYDAFKIIIGLRAFLVSFIYINSQPVQRFANVIYELDEQTLHCNGNIKLFY